MAGGNGFRTDYLLSVCTALTAYIEAAGGVRLDSQRNDNEIVITFTLMDADGIHETHSRLLAKLVAHEFSARGQPTVETTPRSIGLHVIGDADRLALLDEEGGSAVTTHFAQDYGTRPVVLVVDDDHGVLRLVDLELSHQGFDVRFARTAREAMKAVYDQRPELVVLDVMLPDRSGLEVMRELRERVPVPIILLTARGADNDGIRGLELGADDYVAKPFKPAELSARVRAILRRMRAADGTSSVVRAKDVEIDLDRRFVMRAGELVPLTRTEWQLLQRLAEHPGKVLGSVELLTRVWGREFRDDLQYVRVWISRLRGKLDPERSEPELIQTFPGIGYMLNGEAVTDTADMAHGDATVRGRSSLREIAAVKSAIEL